MTQEVTDTDLLEDRLAQGDILRWRSRTPTDAAEYGIVVTADCDLAHNKMKDIISYVPLLRFNTYVSTVWGPEYVSKKVEKILELTISSVREAHNRTGSNQTLHEQAIREWLIRDEAADTASQLLGPTAEPRQLQKLSEQILWGREALIHERNLSADDESTAYIKQLTAIARETFPDGKGSAKTILNALDGHCSSLPGDVFFVSLLPNEGEEGFFALLRHIRQCKLSDISLDPVERPGPPLPARRIGSLRAPFIYALTQQMASVFIDIGLPTYHSKRLTECTKAYLSGAEA